MNVVISNSGSVSKSFIERISLIEGNIAAQKVDAICTVIPQNLDFTDALNETLRNACGYDLDEFILDNIYKPRVGEVYALPGGNLPAKYIFLGIMPRYRTDLDLRESDLPHMVKAMFALARSMLLHSIAFPPLYTGKNKFPEAKAARLITQTLANYIEETLDDVRIICDTPEMTELFSQKLQGFGWNNSP